MDSAEQNRMGLFNFRNIKNFTPLSDTSFNNINPLDITEFRDAIPPNNDELKNLNKEGAARLHPSSLLAR